MRNAVLSMALVTACALFVGCGKTSEPGGPGDTTDGGGAKTFTISVPGDMSLQQGKHEDIAISVNRGSEFKQKVTLTIETPAGITAEPATIEAGAEQSEVELHLEAGADATVGEHTVTVKGKPATGDTVSESFKVEIDAAE